VPETVTDIETELADQASEYYADPLGFVLWAFDWGVGDLVGIDGPDDWQRDYLEEVGRQVRERGFDGIHAVEPIRCATASGHGIGKSALTAWLILWVMSTRPHAKGIVTANTSSQLETKTWAELAKWLRRCVTGHWFRLSSGKMSMRVAHRDHPETWRCDAQTCREENSEAFAGLHAANSTPFYIFDEASAVPDKIWEVAEGGLTDGEPMWFVFGNPTRNTGRFRECFGRFRHRWATRQIDSRSARMPNKQQIQQWVDDYGEDSDFVRVRVRGVFPRAGSNQLIGADVVDDAQRREAVALLTDPLVIGVDVARFGDDQSVIYTRKGRDARTWPAQKFRGIDTMQLAARVAQHAQELRADAVFVDGGGVGGGVVDRLRQLHVHVIEVQFGAKADGLTFTGEAARCANKRAEMWVLMRDWLKGGGAIAGDPELAADLTAVEYGFTVDNAIMLEKKADMKKRGLASPDVGDALALTFSYPVAPRTTGGYAGGAPAVQSDWDPYA
jgi:hypothetical protein